MSYPNSGVSFNDDDNDNDSPHDSGYLGSGPTGGGGGPGGGGGRSPLGGSFTGNNNNNNNNNNTAINDSFRLPPRNPVLESFVNDTQQGHYSDPSTALSAAESRCVGLVASAESFAQQRHAKLQQLFKRIQSANNDEIGDLTGRVSICETALQELSALLEQVQLHISSASSATHEFIRACTVERGKSEGRLMASLNAMLVRYEQQRRHWRQAAAQTLVQQDLRGMRAGLDAVFSGLGIADDDDGDDDDALLVAGERRPPAVDLAADDFTEMSNQEEQQQQQQRIADKISKSGPHMGFLSLEEKATADDDDQEEEQQHQQPTTPLRQVASINTTTTTTPANGQHQQQQQQQFKKNKRSKRQLLKYLPASVRERRRSLLNNFSHMLGQMLIDGDSVDRPFLLDATYARIIRYADVLSLHGEVICRHVAEMFRAENARRTHFLLDGERAIFRSNAEALCPPSLVPINDEPVYTVFVQKLVEGRLEREFKVLSMMDSGLEAGKAATQAALDATAARFRDAVARIVATVTKNGVMVLRESGEIAVDGSALSSVQQQQQQQSSSSSSAASPGGSATPVSRVARGRAAAASFFSSSSTNHHPVFGPSSSSSVAGGAADANATAVSALVTRLLSSVRDGSSAIPAPGGTEEAVRTNETKAMERVIGRLISEVTTTIEEHQAELSATFNEAIAAVQPSPINLINNPTVFSIDSLQSELSHQALLLKVASASEGGERGRLVEQLKEERFRSNALQHDNTEQARKIIVLESERQQREAEMSELESTVALRRRSELTLKAEVKKVTYQVTADAFGQGWQESVLLLRESMIRQMRDEESRLLARVKAYQKRKFDDQGRVVELLERGFVSTQDQIDADHRAKQQQQQIRHEVEMQQVRDECEIRVRNAHHDAQDEIQRSRTMFESLYQERVAELNGAFDDKTRQIEMRQRDWEDRLWSKMKQIRADFREKEVQMEQQYAAKHEAVLRIYEEEANALKRNISDKEALLESERLSVHLEIEKQITEGVNKVKTQHERVRSDLQAMMLRYLQGQRDLFDKQRDEEMTMFSQFAFGGMQFAKDTAFEIVDSNRKSFQQQIDSTHDSIQDATLTANDVTGRLLKHRDELHEKRLIVIKANNETVLRRTQLVRIEQDEKTWNNLHREIVTKGATLDKKALQVETLMTQRYVDIVQTLHGYIQGDVSAAHQTFERECSLRQGQLRRYLNHFHLVSLRVESQLWSEASERNDIEREALSMMQLLMSRSRTEAEYVVRNAIIQAHVSTLNSDAEETTFTTVEALRARYEGLLRRQHQLMGAMSHDYVSSLQHHTAQSGHAQEVMSALFSSRMDELHQAMRQRWELHWNSRDMLVERKLEGLAQLAAAACKELLGGALVASRPTSPSHRRGRSPSRVVVLDDDDPSSSSSSAPAQHDQQQQQQQQQQHHQQHMASSSGQAPPLFFTQDVRVTEYFTAMRHLLAKTFAELEGKILDGQEQRERRQSEHTVSMRARFLEAAGALTRRAEQVEDKLLRVTMEKNTLSAQLHLKTEAEIRAATLADDLKALVGHYRLLTQNVLVHGAFNDGGASSSAELLFSSPGGGRNNNTSKGGRFSGAAGIVPGGAFKRTHLLQRQSTNVPPSFFGVQHRGGGDADAKKQQQQQQQQGIQLQNNDDDQNEPQQPPQQQHQFHAMFLVDVGGKKATRDIVMENAGLRERLMATEWKNDKFLRDALMSAHVEESGEVNS